MIEIQENINLNKYTTFQIGGPAHFLAEVKNNAELLEAVAWAKEKKTDFVILGGGSNVLISDAGFGGLAIICRNRGFEFEDHQLKAEAGAFTAILAREAQKRNLGGLEFASGIPGTIAGAAIGNAGAYGKSMSDILISAEVWENGQIKTYENKDFNFAYRNSKFKGTHGAIILSVILELSTEKKLSEEDILKDAQKRSHDYGGANAGSYFKNLELAKLDSETQKKVREFVIHDKVSTGKIIDSLGLKGKKVGGAMISEQHANVITNFNHASAQDIIDLEQMVVSTVKEKYGLKLEPEVVKIGF